MSSGAAVSKAVGLQDVLICADWLCTDLCRALWAFWKLPGQTDLFTFAQDTNFGPRHALIILPVHDGASGKKPPGTGECSAQRSSRSSYIGNLSHFRGKNSGCKRSESGPALPFCRSTARNWRDSASPFPPMHLPRRQHILVTPFGFLISSSAIRFGVLVPPRPVFSQSVVICTDFLVLIK